MRIQAAGIWRRAVVIAIRTIASLNGGMISGAAAVPSVGITAGGEKPARRICVVTRCACIAQSRGGLSRPQLWITSPRTKGIRWCFGTPPTGRRCAVDVTTPGSNASSGSRHETGRGHQKSNPLTLKTGLS